jgi:glycolate oxidase FAD binding subunit
VADVTAALAADPTGRAALEELEDLARAVAAAEVVAPLGAGTHADVGGALAPPPGAPVTEVRVAAGIVQYDPAELTVTVRAGTAVAELAAVLGAAGQECPLDPRDPAATVGGVLAAGLSGPRRLRLGPLRERVLEVRFVTAAGRLVKGGGPTVKNVTGYDVPRLMVGSLGTLGVLTQVTLRCQPRPPTRVWGVTDLDPAEVRRRVAAPSAVLWDGRCCRVLLEGHPDDVDDQLAAGALTRTEDGPGEAGGAAAHPQADPQGDPRDDSRTATWPSGPWRGRVSVPPAALAALGPALDGAGGVRWLAEWGVGTVHVAADDADGLLRARAAAEAHDGWLLREAGTGVDAFGRELPNADVHRRLKASFDPTGKLNPGRLPW